MRNTVGENALLKNLRVFSFKTDPSSLPDSKGQTAEAAVLLENYQISSEKREEILKKDHLSQIPTLDRSSAAKSAEVQTWCSVSRE